MENGVKQLIQKIHENRSRKLTDQEIFSQFKEDLEKLIQANRLSARDYVIRVLSEETDEGKLVDPLKGDRDVNIWRWCWAAFLELGMFFDADKVIEECYLRLLRLQTKNKKRYHKGTPLQTRAEGLLRVGFQLKGRRSVILAHIEDLITGQTAAPAEMTLKAAGISDEDLKLIASETQKLKEEKAAKNEDLLYPEEVYEKIHFQIDFANVGELNRNLVFTNIEYLNELLKRVNEASEGNR